MPSGCRGYSAGGFAHEQITLMPKRVLGVLIRGALDLERVRFTFQQDHRLVGGSMQRSYCGRTQRRLHHPVHARSVTIALYTRCHLSSLARQARSTLEL